MRARTGEIWNQEQEGRGKGGGGHGRLGERRQKPQGEVEAVRKM